MRKLWYIVITVVVLCVGGVGVLIATTPPAAFFDCRQYPESERVIAAEVQLCLRWGTPMLADVFCIYDGDGSGMDMFVLTNTGTQPWEMAGWSVADIPLPAHTLAPGDYLVFQSEPHWSWPIIGLDETTLTGPAGGWRLPTSIVDPVGQRYEIGPHGCTVPSLHH
jgi:hypothetical protein